MKQSKSKQIAYLMVLAMSVAGWAVASDTNVFNETARQLMPEDRRTFDGQSQLSGRLLGQKQYAAAESLAE